MNGGVTRQTAGRTSNSGASQQDEDVGLNMFSESLTIAAGRAEPRNIKGLATEQQREVLRQIGVPIFEGEPPDTRTAKGRPRAAKKLHS